MALGSILNGVSRPAKRGKASTSPALEKEPYYGSISPPSEFVESAEDAIERIEDEEAIGRLSVDEHNEVRFKEACFYPGCKWKVRR